MPSPLHSPSTYAGDTLGLDDFSLRGTLGHGGTAMVLLVQRKGGAGVFAMKVVSKVGLERQQIDQIVN